jgi:TolA-binding protein
MDEAKRALKRHAMEIEDLRTEISSCRKLIARYKDIIQLYKMQLTETDKELKELRFELIEVELGFSIKKIELI